MKSLRPDQVALVRRISAAFAEGERYVCLQLATGGGKTVIAGEISRMIAAQTDPNRKGGIALYLVHRRELVGQVSRTLHDFGLGGMTGYLVAGSTPQRWQPLQVASVQTLVRRLDKVASWLHPRVVFIDECHHIRARTWEKCLDAFPDSLRIGLTATPARKDGKGLGKYFGRLIEGPPYADLIAAKALSPVETFELPSSFDRRSMKKVGGDYQRHDSTPAPVIAAVLPALERHCRGKRTLVFCFTRRHSRAFVEAAVAAGHAAEHVDGDMPPAIRDAIIKRFRDGRTTVLSNVEIVTEGFDCPECDVVVLARPTASVTLLNQMVGRVMRYRPEKVGLVLDLAGNCSDLGVYPGDDLEWTLADGVRKPEEIKAVASHRVCANCQYAYPRHQETCPLCGHTPPTPVPQEVEISLVAAQGGRRKAKAVKRDLNRRVILTGGDEEQLRAIAREHGYHHGWIRQMKRVFGPVWDSRRPH